MPSVVENAKKWSKYPWPLEGHEWSPGGTPRGTEAFWWRTIRPRLQRLLPAGTVLEIAPGYGRWTAYLLEECLALVGVDVTPACVEACRARFASCPHAQFWVNDGSSLPMVPDASIDAAISLDSLVHVEADTVNRYLQELARTLKPGGLAFFHHSNLGAYVDPATGRMPWYVNREGWRAASMSARTFRDQCRAAGLVCLTQEVINWVMLDLPRMRSACVPLSDCFSTFMRPAEVGAPHTTTVYVNDRFPDEWDDVIRFADLYAGQPAPAEARAHTMPPAPPPAARTHTAAPSSATLATALRLAAGGRLRAVAAAARGRTARALRAWEAATRPRLAGEVLARVNPIARALRSGRCPDCSGALVGPSHAQCCGTCNACFVTR